MLFIDMLGSSVVLSKDQYQQNTQTSAGQILCWEGRLVLHPLWQHPLGTNPMPFWDLILLVSGSCTSAIDCVAAGVTRSGEKAVCWRWIARPLSQAVVSSGKRLANTRCFLMRPRVNDGGQCTLQHIYKNVPCHMKKTCIFVPWNV